jgi:hypothetical protein
VTSSSGSIRTRPTFCTAASSCYRPVRDRPLPVGQRGPADWRQLLELAHTDKSRAFDLYAQHYVATTGQLYRSDAHQLAFYEPGITKTRAGSEMITELYVPRATAHFMRDAAEELRRTGADVVYGTVRLIERDDETFLAWATDSWACVVLNSTSSPVTSAAPRSRSPA